MMRSSVTAAQDLSCVKPKPFKIGLKAFSMIEVMVVSGLLSIIGLAITSVVSNSTKAQKRLEQKEQQQGNAGYIRSILQDPTLCRNAFCPEDGGFASAAATPCGEKQYNKLPPDANWNIAANNPRKIRSIQLYSGGAALQQTVLTCLTTDGCNNHVYNAITNFPPVAPPYGTPVPGSPGLYVYGMMVTEIIDRGVIGSERVSTANLVVQYAQDPKLISGGKFPDTRIALILRATTGGTGRIESCTSGAVDSLWTLHANGLDVFRAGGRVGIGATSPISPLSISGPEGSINIDRFAGGPHLILRQANGTQLAPTATATGDITGRVSGWSYENVGATYSSTGLIDFLAAENQTAAARGGHIAFSTTDTGGVAVTEKMRIAAGGNVGVGTNNPIRPLHVVGAQVNDGDSNTQFRIEDSAAFNANPVAGIHFSNRFNAAGATAGMGAITVRKENGLDGNTSSAMAFHTRLNAGNVTERMRIAATGNVGIGTTSPTALLDVAGTGRFTAQTVPTSGEGLEVGYNAAVGFLQSYDRTGAAYRPVNVLGSDLRFSPSGVEAIRVLTGGNVGIGLPAPTSKLHVVGTTSLVGNTSVTGTFSASAASTLNTTTVTTLSASGLSTLNAGLTVTGAISHTGGFQTGGGAAQEIINYGAYRTTSDARLKQNIIPLGSQSDLINQIMTYNYDYIQDTRRLMHTGVIAQELMKLYPHLVTQTEAGYLNVNYPELIPIVIKGLQESNARILQLEKINEHLIQRIEKLESSLNRSPAGGRR